MVSNYGQFSLPASSREMLKTKISKFIILYWAYSTASDRDNIHMEIYTTAPDHDNPRSVPGTT